jgi:hypothetical protein
VVVRRKEPHVPDDDDRLDDDLFDGDPFDDTVLRTPAPERLRPGHLHSGHLHSGHLQPGQPGDLLGDTVLRPARHRSPAPGPAAPTPPVDVRAPVPSIRIGTRVFRLDRPVLVGRRPGLPRVVRGPVPELVTVPSPTGRVSSSHVLFHASGPTAVVDDLGSTNGTTVRPPGAPPHRMPAGASMVVLTGTVVDIGDGSTIEVLSPFLRSVPPGDRASSGSWPSPPPSPGPSRTPESDPEP